jgi:hypothetical protein
MSYVMASAVGQDISWKLMDAWNVDTAGRGQNVCDSAIIQVCLHPYERTWTLTTHGIFLCKKALEHAFI